jgi:3-phenylpropionate/trans-cinnamate dioxygenase ferredoxin reductase component
VAATGETTDVLLIGGGVASVRCARTLRREGFDGRIMLVGEEPSPPYNRPPLSKELLREDLPDELVLAEPEPWFERRAVELRRGRRVVALAPDAREATLDDGTRITFERCLVATGAQPRPLAVDGGEHALLLRTLADARRLRARAVDAGPGARVTVIGGGFIGVEVASGLVTLGLRPTILEMGDRLWAGTLGEELDRWARDRLDGAGVEVRLGAAVTRLTDAAAWVGDERHDHAFCIAGIGVTPRTELAEAAGLDVDDGILTDDAHRTSHPSVWAAGDVARVAGRRIEHWHAAREGGARAAASMLDRPLPEPRAPWVFSEVAGELLDVVGWAPAWDEAVALGDIGADRFAIAYLADGGVIQIVVVNGAISVEEARSFVERRPRAADLRELAPLREQAGG